MCSVFDVIEEYAPGFKSSVIGRDILTPPDLERTFGLTGGVRTVVINQSFNQFFIISCHTATNTSIMPYVRKVQLECGPMPNLMVALSNIGGALCSTPQSLIDAHY